MPLSQRRLAMLREIGVAVWQPPPVAAPAQTHEPDQVPASLPASVPRLEQGRAASGPGSAPRLSNTAPAGHPAVHPAGHPAALSPEHSTVPASERSRHLALLDWSALREEVAQCQACALGGSRTQTVFGAGSPRAQWLIVGEAPGEQEDLRGEPFVGPAGKLLDAMLRAAGLTRSDEAAVEPSRQVYIANTLKCRPPRNRNPEPGEMLKCEPFLVRQIELLRPRVIIAMGRFAVQSLLRTEEAIGRLRGRVHRYQGVPVVVTYHPAYLLRNLPDKAKAWDDLCLALQTFEEVAGGLPSPG